jgi:TldD protein
VSSDLKLVETIATHSSDAEFVDCRITESDGTSITCQDGRADKIGQGRSRSGCVRALVEGAWGFASTDEPNEKRLARCLESALAMARAGAPHVTEKGAAATLPPTRGESVATVGIDPRKVPLEEKMRRVIAYEKAARDKHGDLLANTIVSYGDGWKREVVANSRGAATLTEQIRTRLFARIVAKKGDARQAGTESRGQLAGFELLDENPAEGFSVSAADRAVSLLTAKRAPSGRFPVVFHPTITGVLVHEALGHSAEADLVFGGMSILDGKKGTRVAPDIVTVIDDPTIDRAYGSFAYDSEGTPAKRHVLIEKGILKGFLHSLETAGRMGEEPSGSARAQSAQSPPIVRMSNTFFEPGEDTLESLLAPIDYGVYLIDSSGGYVFPERGQFVVRASEGWIIRDGKLAEQVRDVSVSGMTLETLSRIDGLSKDCRLALPGTCGKDGQGVPVDGGGPYVRISEVVVGGQEGA